MTSRSCTLSQKFSSLYIGNYVAFSLRERKLAATPRPEEHDVVFEEESIVITSVLSSGDLRYLWWHITDPLPILDWHLDCLRLNHRMIFHSLM